MRKRTFGFVLVLLLIFGNSDVVAQEWVQVPVGVLSFDGTDGQELGHFDGINDYLTGKNCFQVEFNLKSMSTDPGVNPELLVSINEGHPRYAYNLAAGRSIGSWTVQFFLSDMRLVDDDYGTLIDGTAPSPGGFFDYLLVRTWGNVVAEVTSISVANCEEESTPESQVVLIPGDRNMCLVQGEKVLGLEGLLYVSFPSSVLAGQVMFISENVPSFMEGRWGRSGEYSVFELTDDQGKAAWDGDAGIWWAFSLC